MKIPAVQNITPYNFVCQFTGWCMSLSACNRFTQPRNFLFRAAFSSPPEAASVKGVQRDDRNWKGRKIDLDNQMKEPVKSFKIQP